MSKLGMVSLGLVLALTGAGSTREEPKQEGKGKPQDSRVESYEGKSLNEWIKSLERRDPEVRARACYALEAFGLDAMPALPALIRTLRDQNHEVRRAAAHAVGAIGPGAVSAVPALIRALQDQDESVRAWAADSLGKVGPEAVSAVPALIKALQDQDEWVRRWAACSLGKVGPAAKAAVPALVQLLEDKESDVRAYAAWALADIGKEPEIVVKALAAALKKETTPCRRFGSMAFYGNRDAQRDMARSLSRFGRTAVPVLQSLLQQPSGDVRWCALDALHEIGPGAKGATEAVSKVLQDKDEGVGALAASVLVAIEAEPERVIPLLIEALKDKSGRVRLAAAEGLGHFGPKASAAVPLLLKVYSDADIDVGGSLWTIGRSLKRIDPAAARKAGIP